MLLVGILAVTSSTSKVEYTLLVLLVDIFVLTSSTSGVKNALLVLLVGSKRLLVRNTCLLTSGAW